jgi:hypothetical protein
VNDFETVREPHDIRCGDWALCRHAQALGRIEAEVERLRAALKDVMRPGNWQGAYIGNGYVGRITVKEFKDARAALAEEKE